VLAGKTCVIVDDMIDSGGSIRAASIALKELGAKRVIVCAAHGIFSQNAVERLQSGKALVRGEQVQSIDSVYVTDTQRLPVPRSKFLQVVSIAPLLKEVIVRLDQPQGSLQELRERVDLGVLLPIIDG
jgi:ribose-phosphate pyrophosphokinase